MRTFRAVAREIPENLKPLLLMNVLSAVAVTSLVGLVSTAVQSAAAGRVSGRLLVMFAITVALFTSPTSTAW